MKNTHFSLVDAVLAGMIVVVLAAPAFAGIPAPLLGSVAEHTVLDVNTLRADRARSDAFNAFAQMANAACTADATSQDLNNQILTPGVYCFNSSTLINGWVHLDAQGDPNAMFIFKLTNTFTFEDWSQIIVRNGAEAKNIFWQVNGSARIGVGVRMKGTIIATQDITMAGENGIVEGRLISLSGMITMPRDAAVILPVAPVVVIQPAPPQVGGAFQQPAPVVIPTGILTIVSSAPDVALFVDGMRVVSGQPTLITAGTRAITLVTLAAANYGIPLYSGDCSQNGLNGMITINAGEQKTCGVNFVPLSSASVAGGALPGLPNTGGGGAHIIILNLAGMLLLVAFVWKELASARYSS